MTLRTVKVPEAMEAPFVAAESLVTAYFQDRQDLPDRGTIEICGERYLLVRAASLSVEFFSLVDELYGPGRQREADEFSRNILFDLAHAIGKSDAQNFHAKMGLLDPLARLSAGPVHFSLTGWAFVDILPESKPSADENYYLLYDHPYSFESDAWLRAGVQRDFAVCIMNSGYSSGWCEESFGVTLVATEVSCRAAGGEHCRFIMAHPNQIEQHVERYLETQTKLPTTRRLDYLVPDFFSRKRIDEDLRRAHDELEVRVGERTKELRESNELLKHEIAERRLIEEQLVQTRKLEAIGRLAGGIAHDFNNIMAVVVGSAELLTKRLPPDDQLRPIVDAIRAAGNHATTLTQQLLAFSRGQGRVRELLALDGIIADLRLMLEPLIGANIKLVVNTSNALGAIEADRGQLEQVIVNLVVNARDAMPNGGTLDIRTANVEVDAMLAGSLGIAAGPYVQLTVTDDGIGMTDDVVSQMFDPFFTTKETSGTGLGLSTVYGIVKQSGAGIAVTTELARGSSFALYFPRVTVRAAPLDRPAGEAEPRGTETLLLVALEGAQRDLLAGTLRDLGYTVLETGSQREAIRIALEDPRAIDMLISDMAMPEMTGPQLALRVVSTRPRLKVLYVADHTEDLDTTAATPIVIRRPFSADLLARRVRRILDEPE